MSDIALPTIATGSWTPVVKTGGTDITLAGKDAVLTIQGSQWGKIGPFVFITTNINVATLGTPGTGTLTVTGMPFDANVTYAVDLCFAGGWRATVTSSASFITAETPSVIYPSQLVAGANTSLTGADLLQNANLIITAFYMTVA